MKIYFSVIFLLFFSSISLSQTKANLVILLEELNVEIEKNPKNIEAITARSIVNINLKDYKSAIIDLNTLLRYNESFDSYYKRGISFFELQQYDKALADFIKCQKFDSNNKSIILYKAICYDKLNELNNAIDNYHISIEKDNKNIIPLFNLGLLYYLKLQDYDKGLQMLNRTLEIDSSFVDALVGVGRIYQLTEKYDSSEYFYTKAIEKDSLKANAFFNRALVRSKLGNGVGAKLDIEKALNIEPGNIDAILTKIEIYLKLNQSYDSFCEDAKKLTNIGLIEKEKYIEIIAGKCR